MDHGPAAELGQDNASDIKARIGLILFVIYGLVYLGFVALNTLSPKIMSESALFGLNLAVVYGFGLIVLPIIMGLVYNAVCTRYEKRLNTRGKDTP